MDPTQELEAIGEDFSVSLADLSFNSKPIITTLTMIAQENINAAPYITKAVEKRIEKAIPGHKLFAFYLLDSISKNVGSPYTLLFGQRLFQTYTQAYLLVDDATRTKLIDLFKTWKTAKTSSGLPLFPEEPINKIENFLMKASSLYQARTPQPQQPAAMPLQQQFHQPQYQHQQHHLQQPQQQVQQQQFTVPTSQILMPTIEKLLYLTTQRQSRSPNDEKIGQKLMIINQLKALIQAEQIPVQALQATQAQLDDMTRQEEEQLRNTPPPAQPVPNLNNILHSIQAPQPQQVAKPSAVPGKNPLGIGSLSNILKIKSPGVKTPTPPPHTSTPASNVSSLLASLHKSGVLKPKSDSPTSGTSSIPPTSLLGSILAKTAPSGSKSAQITTTSSSTPTSTVPSELSQYDITAKFLTIDPSYAYTTLLITSKPNKCGTCGKRFSNTTEGQTKSNAHLDWHFRVNKKLKDGQVAMSRNWFLDDLQFVQFRDAEVIGDSGDDNKKGMKKVEKKERKYVVVPPEEEDMSCVCGVCKEVLKAKFDDELGEWIWEGAVKRNGKVFHETCFEETQKGALSGLLGLQKRGREEQKLDLGRLNDIVKNVKLGDGSKVKAEMTS